MEDDLDFSAPSDYEENRERIDAEWSTLVALRDTLGLASKGRNASYERAMALGMLTVPELFSPEKSLLNKQRLSETARKYIQLAEAKSEPGQQSISPIALLKEDIAEYENMLVKETLMHELYLIRKELGNMKKALEELQKRDTTENSLIFRDIFQVKRDFPISGDCRNYREFAVSDKRALRIRVLHPDKAESATGADLIYENYWQERGIKLVRIVALQYKIWHGRQLSLNERAQKQLGKMEKIFCDGHMCDEDNRNKLRYRLPYCSAFLRPTDQLQSADATFLSNGCYIPTCVVKKAQQRTKKNYVVHSKDIRSEAVTHDIFEEMFNTNMLGSRWLTYQELEDLYRANNVLEPDEHIIIHAQEVPLSKR